MISEEGIPRTIEDLEKMLNVKLGEGRRLENLSELKDLPTITQKPIDKYEAMTSKDQD